MIKVSVFYPNIAGKKFDMDYYCRKHIPMVQQKLGAACQGVAVEAGRGGSRITGDLYRHGPSLFRFGGGISNRLWASSAGDYGRYPQLHEPPAHDSDQRRENLSAIVVRSSGLCGSEPAAGWRPGVHASIRAASGDMLWE